jgi:hypothetical protein
MLDSKLQENCATYVDDELHSGNKVYEEITEKTIKIFKCRDKEMDNVTFCWRPNYYGHRRVSTSSTAVHFRT